MKLQPLTGDQCKNTMCVCGRAAAHGLPRAASRLLPVTALVLRLQCLAAVDALWQLVYSNVWLSVSMLWCWRWNTWSTFAALSSVVWQKWAACCRLELNRVALLEPVSASLSWSHPHLLLILPIAIVPPPPTSTSHSRPPYRARLSC